MPASTGKTGLGVVLQLGDGASPEVFANVANVVSMEAGGATLELVDATHLGSPNYYREWLPHMKNAQAWTGTLQWNPSEATHDGTTGLRKKMEDRLLTTVRLDPSGMGFTKGLEADVYITELGNISFSVDGVATQSFSMQPTGRVREHTFGA